MRMTNEEFQAEVFRRSAVYMQEKRQSRTRLWRGAAAFAGCFVLIGGALMLRNSFGSSLMFSGTNSACDDASASDDGKSGAEYADEEQEVCSEENAEASAGLHFKADGIKTGREEASAAESENAAEEYPEEDLQDNLTAEELFSALEINPLPKKLLDCTLQINPDVRYDLYKCNSYDPEEEWHIFPYVNGNGETEMYVHISMKQSFELEFEPEVNPAVQEGDFRLPTHVFFVVGEARFNCVAPEYDPEDTERMGELSQALYEAVKSPENHNLTAEQYFSALEINPLPETLGGFTLQADTEANHDVGVYNRFTYLNDAGEPALYVDIYNSHGYSAMGGVYVWKSNADPTAVEFAAGQANVTLKNVQHEPDDADRMEALGKTLRDALLKGRRS